MIQDIIEKNDKAQAGGRELEVLKRYFPLLLSRRQKCFDGEDFSIERFKASLPESIGTKEETVGFNWLGKNYARMRNQASQ